MATTTETSANLIRHAREHYDGLLVILSKEDLRTERASILTAMAEIASTLARLTRGTAALGDMTCGDTLAWDDTASLMTRLAEAEAGRTSDLESGDGTTDIDDYDEYTVWQQLSSSLVLIDRVEALEQLSSFLLAALPEKTPLAALRLWPVSLQVYLRKPGNTVRTRPFAYTRFEEAADACTAGYPATCPTASDYRARITVQAAGS